MKIGGSYQESRGESRMLIEINEMGLKVPPQIALKVSSQFGQLKGIS